MVETHASALDGEGACAATRGGRAGWLVAAVVAVALAGCGGSSAPARHVVRLSPPCADVARAAVASSARVAASSVSATPGTSNGGAPQCVFRAHGLTVTAVVYSGPQPFFLLERTIVEYQQSFTSVRLTTAPVHVGGLGLDAAWFPGQRWVMTTDGVRMITVHIGWHGVSQARRRALGIALARTYLGRLHHNPAAGY